MVAAKPKPTIRIAYNEHNQLMNLVRYHGHTMPGFKSEWCRWSEYSVYSSIVLGASSCAQPRISNHTILFVFDGASSMRARAPRIWWARRESNPHTLRYTILSRARIPVPPLAQQIPVKSIAFRYTSSATAATFRFKRTLRVTSLWKGAAEQAYCTTDKGTHASRGEKPYITVDFVLLRYNYTY